VKAVVDIDIDKTRSAVFKDKGFIEKVDQIWDLVREEAIIAQGARSQ
jgi:NitT/TauT family transport system ATP-binding protein